MSGDRDEMWEWRERKEKREKRVMIKGQRTKWEEGKAKRHGKFKSLNAHKKRKREQNNDMLLKKATRASDDQHEAAPRLEL
jgi:hypothetical protein